MIPSHTIKGQDTCKEAREFLLVINRKERRNGVNYPNVEVGRFHYKYLKENRGKNEQSGQKENFKNAYAK